MFFSPVCHQGILPTILAALMDARAHTRTALKAVPKADTAAAAVLDSRQKALKIMANALYGFTGGPEIVCSGCCLLGVACWQFASTIVPSHMPASLELTTSYILTTAVMCAHEECAVPGVCVRLSCTLHSLTIWYR